MNENHDKQPNHELNERQRKLNSSNSYIGPRNSDSYDEEFAADLLNLDGSMSSGDATSGAMILGFLGLVATIIALFNYSFILGAVGIALGVYAVSKGAKFLGIATICIGLVAVVFPLFYNGPFMSLF
jgi:hypothetical protein